MCRMGAIVITPVILWGTSPMSTGGSNNSFTMVGRDKPFFTSRTHSVLVVFTRWCNSTRTGDNLVGTPTNSARFIPAMTVKHLQLSWFVRAFSSAVLITFRVRRSRREMCISRVFVSVCLSVCPSPHSHSTARTRMWVRGMIGDAL